MHMILVKDNVANTHNFIASKECVLTFLNFKLLGLKTKVLKEMDTNV